MTFPAVLLGLQHLYSHEETREKLFSLLEEHILPGTNRNVGTSGDGAVADPGDGCPQTGVLVVTLTVSMSL